MTAAYVEDTDRLGLGRPDSEPKASETIEAIVALIEDLVDSGHAYEAGGDVYFSVPSFGDYGKLSNRPTDEMRQGEGDDAAALKRAPQDFALWKATKEGEDTSWSSPWGEGRPGWHIECSAMAEELLGVDFEVHGGGSDLVFPHHENEIAQTEAARGRPLARRLDAQRHGRDGRREDGQVGGQHPPAARGAGRIRRPRPILMWLVSAHYRKPIGFSEEALAQAEANVRTIRELVRRLDPEAPAAEEMDDARRALLRRPGGRLQHRGGPRRPLRVGGRGQSPPRAPASDVGSGRLREMLYAFGLERLVDEADEEAPEEVRELADRREAARAGARLRRGGPAAGRACGAAAGRSATPRTAPGSSRRSVIVYGRNPVREALRGPRPVEQSGPPSAPRASPGWSGVEVRVAGGGGDRGALRLAGAPGHLRRGRALPLRGCRHPARAARGRSSCASTRCRTRTTSAPSAGWRRPRAAPAS